MNYCKGGFHFFLCVWVVAALVLSGCSGDEQEKGKAQTESAGQGVVGAEPEPEPPSLLLTTREAEQAWCADVNGTAWLDTMRKEALEHERDAQAAREEEAALLQKERAAKAAAKRTAKPAGKKAPAAPARAVSLEEARTQFDGFARKWVARIGRNLRYTAANMEVKPHPDGVMVRFAEVQHEGLDMEVKPSASGGKKCPYIGVLRYLEHRYENVAPSEGEARKGPFTRSKTMRVTEIFRFVSGRWVN